jgi:hypothetical protein
MKRVGALLASALVAGCGTVAAAPHAPRLPSSATPSLATSEMSATETWAVVVMGGSSAGAVAVTGPGTAWRSLPPLPAGAAGVPAAAATLAAGPGSGFEALIAHGGQLSVWQQTAGGTGWEQVQVIKVAIPYGSSG